MRIEKAVSDDKLSLSYQSTMSSAKTSSRQTALPHEAPRSFFIHPVTSTKNLIDVASLFKAYAVSLEIDLSF